MTAVTKADTPMDESRILTLLRQAYDAFAQGQTAQYDRLTGLAAAELAKLPADAALPLRGEYALVAVLPEARDAAKLRDAYLQAEKLLGGEKSRILTVPDNIGFSIPDVFSLFYTAYGSASTTMELLEQAMEVYTRLTGQGTCTQTLYAAEYAYYSGKLDEAENLSYKTMYLAHASDNRLYYQLAAKFLAQIARHRSDTEGWRYAMKNMYSASVQTSQWQDVLRTYLNIYRDELYLSVGSADSAAYRLHNEIFPRQTQQGTWESDMMVEGVFCAYPMLVWEHTLYLLQKGRYAQAVSIARLAQETWGKNNLILDMYCEVLTVCCLLKLGRRDEACVRFDILANKLARDGLWLIMVEFVALLEDLPERLRDMDGGIYERFTQLSSGYMQRIYRFRDSVMKEESPDTLTPREREIVTLVVDGLRNREIAELLGVTERTVKAHMTNIFNKLSVDSRGKLVARVNKTAF